MFVKMNVAEPRKNVFSSNKIMENIHIIIHMQVGTYLI